ncbi:CD9 antigen-like [Ptychodera flava]|uniref:CD9 antigen-like n=1 Tax=Ptychodera flava TaxID=63121 RepID=UPI00396A2C0E
MAVEGSCMKFIKYSLFVFNLVFWFAGLFILALGLWLRFDVDAAKYIDQLNSIESNTAQQYYNGTYILISAGVLVTVVGFCGCCGAIQERKCLLVMFFISLLLIFSLQVTAGIWGYINIVQLETLIEDETQRTVKEKYPIDKATRLAMDYVQQKLRCCGADDYRDWQKSSQDIPKSCYCTDQCDQLVLEGGIYRKGCTLAVFSFLERNLYIIGGVSIGVGLIQILGMIFSVLLCCNIRKADSEASYI